MPNIIDCRGLNCPQPVINTKKALDQLQSGQITVIVDNPASRQNVIFFARNAGYQVVDKKENGEYHLTIAKSLDHVNSQKEVQPENHDMPRSLSAKPIYFFTTNVLGQGSQNLGDVLMESLIHTLVESEPAPEALIFLNSGIYLVCEEGKVLDNLLKLFNAGTDIIACGTCLDYYNLKDKLAVGRVSNMYEIISRLNGPHKVVTIA